MSAEFVAVIPTLWSRGQEYCEFEGNLGYTEKFCLKNTTSGPTKKPLTYQRITEHVEKEVEHLRRKRISFPPTHNTPIVQKWGLPCIK